MIPALFPPTLLETVISATVTTSAGIFDTEGRLVRELWSGEVGHPDRNDPQGAWDGRLEDGSTAPTADYVARVIEHECVYTWEGAVGNVSPTALHNTLTYHNEAGAISGMEITASGDMFYTSGYSERHPVQHKMNTSNPTVTDWAVNTGFRTTWSTSYACCTDGTIAYWSLMEPGSNLSFVWGSNCSTKAYISFTFNDGVYQSTLSMLAMHNAANGAIGGMAVQKGSGTLLFVSRPGLNNVYVLNKTTGQLLATNAMGTGFSPSAMAVESTSGALWLAHNSGGGSAHNTISKYTANSISGVLTATGVSITGLSDVVGLTISPDQNTVLVADAGSSQQVKAFNTSDGSVLSAFGTSGVFGIAGGYATGPAVTNNKFMFASTMGFGSSAGWIAYEADGSWWLGDNGNARALHFQQGFGPVLLETVSWAPHAYSCRLNQTEPTRLFHAMLEFEINYDLPLENGWTLKRNWFTGMPGPTNFNSMKYVTTLSNGRTYCSSDNFRMFELDPVSGARDMGFELKFNPPVSMEANGDIWYTEQKSQGQVCNVFRNALVGFDGSNNPVWNQASNLQPAELVYTSETLPTNFPTTATPDVNMDHHAALTEGGILPIYNLISASMPTAGYNHFGGIHAESGKVMFSTHKPVPLNNGALPDMALYPEAPFFPRFVAVGDFGGGQLRYVPGKRDIFTCYRGENWGNNQTNVWSHWDECGLMLDRFGPAAPYFGAGSLQFPGILDGSVASFNPHSFKGLRGMAGNTAWGGICEVDGKYYIYQNDEWYHGGPSRWCVSNCESIQRHDKPFHWDSGDFPLPGDPTDLLAGVDYNARPMVSGSGGWTRTIAEGAFVHNIWTNLINSDPLDSPDIYVYIGTLQSVDQNVLFKDIVRSGSGDWSVDGRIFFKPGSDFGLGNPSNCILHFDILDNTGKRIVRLHSAGTSGLGSLYVNGTPMFTPVSSDFDLRALLEDRHQFSISADLGGNQIEVNHSSHSLTVSGVHEVGANMAQPARIAVHYLGGSSAGGGTAMGLIELHFRES